MNTNTHPVVAYYGLTYATANQYSGDIARGVSASYQRFDSPSQYWDFIPEYRRDWKGWDLWEVKYDKTGHIYYAKNVSNQKKIFLTKSNIPCGILDLISFDCRCQ